MHRLTLPNLLRILVATPLVALAVFAAILTYQNLASYWDVQQAAKLQRLAAAATHFAAKAAPGEGRATYPFLLAGTPEHRKAMERQRSVTNRAFATLQAAANEAGPLNPRAAAVLSAILERRDRLAEMRGLADQRRITRTDMGVLLQEMASLGGELVGRVAGLIDDIRIARLVLALQATLEVSTGSLNEGGRGEIAFQTKTLSPSLYRVMSRGVDLQTTFGRQLEIFGPDSVNAELKAMMEGPHGRLIEKVRPTLLAFEYDKLDPSDARPWTEADQARRQLWLSLIDRTETMLAAQTAQISEAALHRVYVYSAACAVTILLTLLLGVLVLRVVRSLLGALSSAMVELANGELAVTVPAQERTDEIGSMARTVQIFKDGLIRMRTLEEESALARASADAQRRSTVRDMADAFERAVSGIVACVTAAAGDLQGTARTMADTAGETITQSMTVTAAAEEASANVNTVAAAAEELGASVLEIGRQVGGSADLARGAVTEAAQAKTLVQNLNEGASRIGDVVDMISQIAAQTNLLALNATIEAARAGVAGRGFAVVAAEVKQLATQTARATADISEQIGAIQAATHKAVSAIGLITARIEEISGVATMIAAAVEEQGAATQEIVRNVTEAAVGTSDVTSNMVGVTSAAEGTGVAADRVLNAASELRLQSERLGTEVNEFLLTVRAA